MEYFLLQPNSLSIEVLLVICHMHIIKYDKLRQIQTDTEHVR